MRRMVILLSCLSSLSLTILITLIYMNSVRQHDSALAPYNDIVGSKSSRNSSGIKEKTPVTSSPMDFPLRIAFFDSDRFAPCYFDLKAKTLYVWKGVFLLREQIPNAGESHRIPILKAKDYRIIPIEAPVKYYQINGKYYPGYLDRTAWQFYAWKSITLLREEMPTKSLDGEEAIVKPAFEGQTIGTVDIDMPAHLKAQPELWIKGVSPSQKGNTHNSQESANIAASAEIRAEEPRIFTFPVRIIKHGNEQFWPGYADLGNKILYQWKGISLKRGQLPDSYKGIRTELDPLNAKDYKMKPVDAPVRYRKDFGNYRPGYLDRSTRSFYQWKSIILSTEQVPSSSSDGKPAIVEPHAFRQLIEIDVPAHLKDKPELWTKK